LNNCAAISPPPKARNTAASSTGYPHAKKYVSDGSSGRPSATSCANFRYVPKSECGSVGTSDNHASRVITNAARYAKANAADRVACPLRPNRPASHTLAPMTGSRSHSIHHLGSASGYSRCL
jgi:hypothetical protein